MLNRKLENKEFAAYWKNQYNNMADHGDFAHQQITTATILYDKRYVLDRLLGLPHLFLGKEKLEGLSGWLGDATLDDSLLGAELSFGADDYKADLDAENISYLMEKEGLSYQDAVNK
ncbi:MAG TPA: hypothetical protein VK119_01575 [Bacillota bacterium]|nr:hypothetical protein [Bacillota bacterium]